jgi:hypothetical protein
MTQGRCLHGMVDVSWTTTDDQGVETLHPAILVFGGAKQYINSATDRALIGWDNADTFAEIIDENGSASINVTGANWDGTAKTTGFSLAGHAATRMRWDDENKGPANDIVAVAAAGFIQSAVDQDLTLSPSNYVIRGVGDITKPKELAWNLYTYGTSIQCAYATMAAINSSESFPVQYAALNCGASESIERAYDTRAEQQIYVIEVRAAAIDGGGFNLITSARAGITGSSTDSKNPGLFLDGPVTTNNFGQAFIFGTRFVYVISGFSYGLY